MKKIEISQGKLNLTEEVEFMFEKTITKFGTGAKIDAVKKHLGKKVYVLICKSNPQKTFKQNIPELKIKR